MLEKSAVSDRILDYFSKKYSSHVSVVGLLKIVCALSPFLKSNRPYLSLCTVAPSRQFKSQISREMENIISPKVVRFLSDDITMHGILEDLNRKNFKKGCLVIDDATTLFATKSQRTKERLISGLSNLLAGGKWSYSDRMTREESIEGDYSFQMNLTLETYKKYEKKLLGSTFLERFLTIFYNVPQDELEGFIRDFKNRVSMKFGRRVSVKKNVEIVNYEVYKPKMLQYSKVFSIMGIKAFLGSFDQVKNCVIAHAVLNGRNYLCDGDFEFLEMIKPYLVNPSASNNHLILEMYIGGMDVQQICEELGKSFRSYKSYVYRVIEKAKERGIVK